MSCHAMPCHDLAVAFLLAFLNFVVVPVAIATTRHNRRVPTPTNIKTWCRVSFVTVKVCLVVYLLLLHITWSVCIEFRA